MKSIFLQLQHRVIGLPEEVQKLLTNYKIQQSLDLKMTLSYMLKNLKKKGLKIAKDFPLSDLDNHKRKR